jgi:hypothetical protein
MLPFGAAHGLVDEDEERVHGPAFRLRERGGVLDLALGGARLLVAVGIVAGFSGVDGTGSH